MGLFKQKQENTTDHTFIQTARNQKHPFHSIDSYMPLSTPDMYLYDAIREAVPIVDAAITKIIRLVGGMVFSCEDKKAENALNAFAQTVKVGSSAQGLESFLGAYLDNMIMYGNGVGEIVMAKDRRQIRGLYNACLHDVQIKRGKDNFSVSFYHINEHMQYKPVPYPELILFTALNPQPGEVSGTPVLKSVPFVTSVLLKIYNATGLNFDRVGNIRFSVTYKPGNDNLDKAYAKERAMEIAKEWSAGMSNNQYGVVHDFISVGDVDIKVIGADNQVLDTDVPVRQMLEQIIAKLSIPPFMLGLNWSTTERMSKQQTTILTSEIQYYRRLLEPIALKIARLFLRLNGFSCNPFITWDTINFDEDIEEGQARLYHAQAEKLELENALSRQKQNEKEVKAYQ